MCMDHVVCHETLHDDTSTRCMDMDMLCMYTHAHMYNYYVQWTNDHCASMQLCTCMKANFIVS